MSRNLIVVDLETTGLGPQCAPIEVAAINVDTGETLEFVPYVDLSRVSIEPQAFAINRYFERGVYDAMLNPDDTITAWSDLADGARRARESAPGCAVLRVDAGLAARMGYRRADLT